MRSASMTAFAELAEFRAAGTDLSERRRSGVSRGPLIDIAADRHIGIDWGADGAARIGAFTTIAAIAADARIAKAYPGLVASALVLPRRRSVISRRSAATSRSVRAAGTPQSAYRLPEEGRNGLSCPQRQSSLWRRFRSRPLRGAASLDHGGGLLAYDAKITTDRRSGLTIGEVFGDGTNGAVDHALHPAK